MGVDSYISYMGFIQDNPHTAIALDHALLFRYYISGTVITLQLGPESLIGPRSWKAQSFYIKDLSYILPFHGTNPYFFHILPPSSLIGRIFAQPETFSDKREPIPYSSV